MRKNLSLNKKGWMQKLDQYKKQLKEANEASKREHQRLQMQIGVVEEQKKKRDAMYQQFGLIPDEQQVKIENMPLQL